MSRSLHFKNSISGISLPKKFTYPFYYEPHPLAQKAVTELQNYLENQTDFIHNFGLKDGNDGTPQGKMFGILVVRNSAGKLGYLAAFSGYLADKSLPEKFVPPLFNLYSENSFFKKGEEQLNIINRRIANLETTPRFLELKKTLRIQAKKAEEKIVEQKLKLKAGKRDRKARRKVAEQTLSGEEFINFQKQIAKESYFDRYGFKAFSEKLNEEIISIKNELEVFTSKIEALKKERKEKSAALQQKIFDQFQFLNINKTTKSLTEIFPNSLNQKPPAGAGECAAPKLLQYAFSNDLMPITMAEFWWGVSPSTEVRIHKNFYPACQGRCKPILTHMLEGIDIDENPILIKSGEDKEINIVYEDESIAVINKPEGYLSVPGKEVSTSVLTKIRALYPKATGPLLVHRLDMCTSGILLVAKTKESHKNLQSQFMERLVKKRYVALLDGILKQDGGYIELPLRVDLNDRPRQLVCYEYGKHAKTQWKVIERSKGKTRVHFYPITGRTHQLRVHAAHSLGLNTPIVGDDLYGKKANRLHLHAEYLEFRHPTTGEKFKFKVEAGF